MIFDCIIYLILVHVFIGGIWNPHLHTGLPHLVRQTWPAMMICSSSNILARHPSSCFLITMIKVIFSLQMTH